MSPQFRHIDGYLVTGSEPYILLAVLYNVSLNPYEWKAEVKATSNVIDFLSLRGADQLKLIFDLRTEDGTPTGHFLIVERPLITSYEVESTSTKLYLLGSCHENENFKKFTYTETMPQIIRGGQPDVTTPAVPEPPRYKEKVILNVKRDIDFSDE